MLHSNFLQWLLEAPPRQAEGEDERCDAEAEHSEVSPILKPSPRCYILSMVSSLRLAAFELIPLLSTSTKMGCPLADIP